MTNTCRTRPPRGEETGCAVRDDAEAVAALLEDAAHFPGGYAAGIAMPRTEADVARLLREHRRVLPIGVQSSLTGGATPFGELLVSTARLSAIRDAGEGRITVGAGVPLEVVEQALRERQATFPPAPTFTGATAGGVVSTNAAGAATFKYGTTRDWVEGLTVVLANGEVLELIRGECTAGEDGFVVVGASGRVDVPLPRYVMPDVPKRSAGYHAAPGMDLVDLFVGAEGTLGVVTEVTLRALTPAPAVALALVFCQSDAQGFRLAADLRRAAIATWRRRDPRGVDVRAIEHVDDRSLALLRRHAGAAETGVAIPVPAAMALLVELELPAGTTSASVYDEIQAPLPAHAGGTGMSRFCRLLDDAGLLDSTEIAPPGDVRRQEALRRFRESVPACVNRLVGLAKREVDPRIEKTAADMIVPFEVFPEMMDVYRRGFAEQGLDYAIWGHISDGNVHPNVIPRTLDDVRRGKEAILRFGEDVSRLGGSPLAEHGVGRNAIKQQLLRRLYGDAGIEQMRAVKRALDPRWTLAPGVIFPPC